MATLTASLAASSASPKRVHAGTNQATVNYVTQGDEGGDTILMLRMPNRVEVHDVILGIPANLGAGGSDAGFAVGDQNDAARFITSASASSTATLSRMNVAASVGYKYDFDDSVAESNRLDRVTLTFTGTTTSSITISLSVLYAAIS